MKKITTLILSLFLLTNIFSQTTHTVNAGGYYYTPTNLTIELGDSVVWINDGGFHDVNGDINSITDQPFNNPETFDSPSTSTVGGVIFGYRFTIEGTYNYDCSVGSHAANGMVGSVIVNPAPVAYTNILDENFEQALIDEGIDDVLDGQVLTSSVNTVERLEISELEIADLTGIEDFTSLSYLECGDNSLTSIDLSQNIALDTLVLYYNEIASLDLSNNVQLKALACSDNQLISLDLSNNTLLDYVDCSGNQLSSLDLSNNTQLVHIEAYDNQLLSMDVSGNSELIFADFEYNQLSCLNLKNGNNTNFIELWTQYNTNLTCIEVDDSVYSNTNWIDNDDFYIGDDQYFSLNCNYPESCSGTATGPKTYVPDDNFEDYLEANLMGDGIADNDSVFTGNISSVVTLAIESYSISDLTGIEDFTALTSLNCGENSLTSIDVSQNIALEVLAVYGNELTTIDISNNLSLVELDVEENQLTALNLDSNTLLATLFCSANQLNSLDVSANTLLEELIAYDNQLTSMDVSQNTALTNVDFEINQLSCLNLKNGNNSSIEELWTQENPDLSCIEVDDSVYSNTNWLNNDEFYLDSNHYFSNNCNYTPNCGSTTTSVAESKFDVQVYPNPTNADVTIQVNGNKDGFKAELFDVMGRSLIRTSSPKMSLSAFPSGLYLLRVNFNNHLKDVRIIKN
jgi:plastocyanin